MKRWLRCREYIIYLLLAVMIVTAGGLGLDEKRQVFFAYHHSAESTLSRQMFTVSNDLHTLELRDNTSNLSTIRSMKENRSNTVESSGLLLLLIGVIFAGIYRLLHQFCMWCAGCAIEERMQVIRFIHDTDGRKRNTISRWRMNW